MAAQLHQGLISYFAEGAHQTVSEAAINGLLCTLQSWQPGCFAGVPSHIAPASHDQQVWENS
eukprot:12217733-Karenia_brevis.AAC.1